MKTIIIAFISVCISLLPHTTTAQQQIIVNGTIANLPKIDNPNFQADLQHRAKECVRQMNTYITSMTMPPKRDRNGKMRPTLQDRRDCRMAALGLFMDNGDSICLANGVKCAPALMEVTNKNGRTKPPYPVKDYFTNLIKLLTGGTYTTITITSSEIAAMDVTSIKKVGDRYKCVVSYTQNFIARRGEIQAYKDKTKKEIEVWFEFHRDFLDEEVIEARLGDVHCVSTE